jgi:hypothetical protein
MGTAGTTENLVTFFFDTRKNAHALHREEQKIPYREINFLDPEEFQFKFLTGQSEVFI